MIKKKFLIVILLALASFPLASNTEAISLKTENMDDVVEISSFILNGKGEMFLFSPKLCKIFKFKPDGTFAMSFCRNGEGPGEITRVFAMFHNPVNDWLYLPEFVSGGKAKVTIYDSDGTFKGLLTPELSRKHMDQIWEIVFLKDGSYVIVTKERVGWKPEGKFFLTQQETWVRYFNPAGKLAGDIFKMTAADELSQAVNWGGPSILFRPSLLVNATPDENYIAVARTDENHLSLYDKQGKKIKTITLEIPRETLTDEQFNAAKQARVKLYEGKTDMGRMLYLAKNMIKLEYKPIYANQFLTPAYIILAKIASRDEDGYPKTSKLIFFDWKGKKKGEKIVEGYVMNIKAGNLLIQSYDDESNEHFRIEEGAGSPNL
jgi:hypothetical protein